MARTTLSARLTALEASVQTLVDALTPAPVAKGAPATAKANTFFDDVIVPRARDRKPCAIKAHKGICNRTFSLRSGGDVNHTASIG